ncbi:MAG: hypothetical protein P8O70_20265 [SAR324 cluster bacterium]|nr:hypothetical protein [SAR324 cluster bacterium]
MITKIKILAVLFFVGFGTGIAQAQFFGFSVDTAVDYTVAPDKVTGGTLGIIHPIGFVPNFGYTQVKFKEESMDVSSTVQLNTDVTITSYNIFFNVPFPVVAVSLGAGVGEVKVESSLTGYGNKPSVSKPVIEGFTRIGLPFWNFIEFHLGIHAIKVASKIDAGDSWSTIEPGVDSVDTDKDYTGTLTTVGLQFAF